MTRTITTATTSELEEVAVVHAAAMLDALGITGDAKTAGRFTRALDELTAGRRLDPARHLEVTFPAVSQNPGLVAVRRVPVTSVCAHHLLPFSGEVTVAYLPKPGQKIVGLSKLARVAVEFAARPQVQEQLTGQIVDALDRALSPAGAACAITASHSCMCLRGVRTGPGAQMVTTEHRGVLAEAPWRAEFAQLAAG